MQVLLMYPDRDFVPTQALPSHATALTQDLELTTLFEAMARGDKFLLDVARQAVLSSLTDPELIRYRQAILQDCLKNPEVVRQVYRIPIQAMENKRRHWLGLFGQSSSVMLSGGRAMLEMFMDLLTTLRQIADRHAGSFESKAFTRFFAMVRRELDDAFFAEAQDHLKTLQFRRGVWLSAELGQGNEGTHHVLRRANHDRRHWMQRIVARRSPEYSFSLPPRDDAGARALSDLRDLGVHRVARAVAQSADHIDAFLRALRVELAFYIGCLNLSDALAQLEEPIAFPGPAPAGDRRHSFAGLYDVSLALTMKQKVVGNDVTADGKDLAIITGANRGGKSTFLRSIGQAQLMMQCGMFVPAESFRANVCTALFTHYRREEDTGMTSGKFDEELGRMSAIVERLTPDAMVLFNESFAATNEREGSEIARQIVSALLEGRIKVFYVTHLYELARGFHDRQMENAIFLRAERQADGTRTFRLIEGGPLETSHGMDLYGRIFG